MKKKLLLVALLLAGVASFAALQDEDAKLLDKSGGVAAEIKLGTKIQNGTLQIGQYTWEAAVDGYSHDELFPFVLGEIPANAVIKNVYYSIRESLTAGSGGGAAPQFSLGVSTFEVGTSNPKDYGGNVGYENLVPNTVVSEVYAGSTFVQGTVEGTFGKWHHLGYGNSHWNIYMRLYNGYLTAGKIVFFVEYVVEE